MAKLTKSQIIARGQVEGLTPYRIWQLLNLALTEAGFPVVERPQMIYNYDRNGMIAKGVKHVTKNRDSGTYTLDEAMSFIDRRLAKAAEKYKAEAETGTVSDEVEGQLDMLAELES